MTIALLCASFSAYNQSYRHNIGLGYSLAWRSQNSGNISVFEANGSIGLRYMAAVKFQVTDKIDFVGSIDPFIFAYPVNTINGSSLWGSFDLPLDLKFYFGGIDKTAFFLGTGVNYYWLNWMIGEDTGFRSFGPQAVLGFNKKINRLGFGFRAAFTYGLIKQSQGSSEIRSNLFSFGIYMILPAPKEE